MYPLLGLRVGLKMASALRASPETPRISNQSTEGRPFCGRPSECTRL